VADPAVRRAGAQAGHDLLELLAVLARPDDLDLGPDQLHPEPGKGAGLMQLDSRVQGRLAAHGGEHGVRALDRDDLLQDFQRDRLHIGRVGELGVRHDRGGVGVDQADPQALLLQHPACLGA
jgi:hypothetical protein